MLHHCSEADLYLLIPMLHLTLISLRLIDAEDSVFCLLA